MVIDVRKLKFSGKYESDFEFEYYPTDNLVTIPNAVLSGAISVVGHLELHNDDVYVDGTVRCKIVGECARCLKEAVLNYQEDFSVIYATEIQEDDDYLYKNGLVDLKLAVDDLLLTSQPTIIYCVKDCKGLCPICGQDLNEKSCDCRK